MSQRSQTVMMGGLYAGLAGYATVVVLVALMNMLGGLSPFYTAALFGNKLFYGMADGNAVDIAVGPVLAYNAAHLLFFLLAGFFGSWLVEMGEEYPVAQYGLFALLLFVALAAFSALFIFALPLMGSAAWWRLGVPSIAAAVAMGWVLLKMHPTLRQELKHIPWGESTPVG